ncbi:pseudouridine synthase [Anaerocolumna cellulosilytica]|uniref:Pseudouridine synthase n=1 Tax=Anaerocolumna cellulosilytica TaxID=433286 RepID=A0A6S6R7B5_9FIRM|nr:23S rRNA pseudouridine(2604) synthase RluF [Anaerocolumna cellulosilytica]MBB5193886.1 23S rRNA pseudouridine2604 synthase [Anaerocolumna cellulosilytica]BCJ94898.1 pseudouridine synthase [Anaerocolumna cellulosilytica]
MAKRTKQLIEQEQTEEIRLNRFLSDAGVCSRRDADKYIAAGDVTVDGVTALVGTKIKAGQAVIFKGKPVKSDNSLVLIAFNKPRGIVCTTDKRDKDNIIDYINYGKRIYPIGRLDKDSEGLILLTNDGNIVNKILRAGNNHEKEYIVTVNKTITSEFLKGMAAGVPILDTVTLPCTIKALDKNTFQIILTQGLNRQIRRMCEYFGFKVVTLKRIRIMNISIGHLQLGGYRNITAKEIGGLNELIRGSANAPEEARGMEASKKITKTKSTGNGNRAEYATKTTVSKKNERTKKADNLKKIDNTKRIENTKKTGQQQSKRKSYAPKGR